MSCSMLKNEPQELCNITLDQNAAAFGRKFVITKDVYLCTVIYLTDTEQLTGLWCLGAPLPRMYPVLPDIFL